MILAYKIQHNILYEAFSRKRISGQFKILQTQGKTFTGKTVHTTGQKYKLHQHDRRWQKYSATFRNRTDF